MKRYYFLSLLIHSLFLLTLLHKAKILQEKSGMANTTGPNANGSESVMEIIEISPIGDTKQEFKNFYYGLGITCDEYLLNIPDYGMTPTLLIRTVHSGYSAESSGLQAGDVIYLVNGQPVGDGNDVKGDEPKDLALTILKKDGRIIVINIKRVKVYY